MKKTFSLLVVLLAVIVASPAQDASQPAAKPPTPKKTAYRIDLKLYELEDGKRVNQRDYSLIAAAYPHGGPSSSLRIGTKVPVLVEEKKYSYVDVGFNFNCRLTQEDDGRLWGTFDVEVGSFALPEQNADPRVGGNPVLRNTHQNVETTLTPGKSMVLTTIDDLSSKKRTQIEVVATKLD